MASEAFFMLEKDRQIRACLGPFVILTRKMVMTDRKRFRKFAAIAAVGGLVFQVTGCAAGLVPVFLSFVESSLITALLGGLF
jgi:hypothetical protein